jgi:hypothetical protein
MGSSTLQTPIVQGPFSVAPCQTLAIRDFFIAVPQGLRATGTLTELDLLLVDASLMAQHDVVARLSKHCSYLLGSPELQVWGGRM